jgi:hypothetical protein
MSKVLLHCGGQSATRKDIETIPVPEQTDTYMPVPHNKLIDTVGGIGFKVLQPHGYRMVGESFGLSRNGKQFFGVLTYKNGNDGLGLSVGFRNSYDKSMTIGICSGAKVFVCDNLAFHGNVTVLRKHTANVWTMLEEQTIGVLFKSLDNYEAICIDMAGMKETVITDDTAFRTLGLLYGHKTLSLRQLEQARKEWVKPSFEDFAMKKDMWRLYNAGTFALKSCKPGAVMEKHIELHNTVMAQKQLIGG